MKICQKIGLTVAMTLGWVQAVIAAPQAVSPIPSSAVTAMHQFLQTTKTLKADFSQTVTASGGRKPQLSSGSVQIARPGKLRWDIQKPYPQLLVGDGEKFWIYDPDLQQVMVRKANQAIGGTPAALLAGSNELEKNFTLKEAGEADGLIWLEAIPKVADAGFEKLRIGFAGNELKAMTLFDNFGQVTQIQFSKIERNPVIPAGQFRFVPPAGVDVLGQ